MQIGKSFRFIFFFTVLFTTQNCKDSGGGSGIKGVGLNETSQTGASGDLDPWNVGSGAPSEDANAAVTKPVKISGKQDFGTRSSTHIEAFVIENVGSQEVHSFELAGLERPFEYDTQSNCDRIQPNEKCTLYVKFVRSSDEVADYSIEVSLKFAYGPNNVPFYENLVLKGTFSESSGGVPEEEPSPDPPTDPQELTLYGDGRDGDVNLLSGQTLSPNSCYELVRSENGTALINSSVALSQGTRVLVLQTQDSFQDTSGASLTWSTASLPGNAGKWAIASVVSSAAEGANLRVTLDPMLENGIESAEGVSTAQLCTVPQYENVTISEGASLEATAWDGTTGGVIAFYAKGTTTVTGQVSANGKGFRPGASSDNDTRDRDATRGNLNEDTTGQNEKLNSGGKGEGTEYRTYGMHGRGVRGNAGGGGNTHNAGGGGGGGAGGGGFGQTQDSEVVNTSGRGGGGHSFVASERIFFGGGGGGGHQNNDRGTGGGAGGGAVWIKTANLAGSGSIQSNGDQGVDAGSDGAGGGGGGGTIVVDAEASTFSGTIIARGGRGGNASSTRDGPGGGGGGGLISAASIPAAMKDVSGGERASREPDPNDPDDETKRYSFPGVAGRVEN